jgi:hypothetical protein
MIRRANFLWPVVKRRKKGKFFFLEDGSTISSEIIVTKPYKEQIYFFSLGKTSFLHFSLSSEDIFIINHSQHIPSMFLPPLSLSWLSGKI